MSSCESSTPPKVRISRLRRRLLRLASGAFAFALALWAWSDDGLIGGGAGFGWTQAAVLAVAVTLAASCLGPVEWNARVFTLVLSTALGLTAVELALRGWLSPRYLRPFEADAGALYRLVPGAVREHRLAAVNGGGRIVYRINGAGFRGDELARTGEAPRILVYGDSFVQGEFAALPSTFAERLETRISDRIGTRVEVVNAGVAGYGPDQILNKMQGELAGLSPDLVLVALFTGNDFGDPLRNKLYRIGADGELRENAFTIDADVERQLRIARREAIVKLVLRDAAHTLLASLGLERSRSDAIEALSPRERMDSFLDQRRREYDEYVVRGDAVVREMSWDTYDADVSLDPESDSARYKIELMDRLVVRIRQATDAIPVPLVLVLIPHPIDVGGHEQGEVDRARYPEYRPGRLSDLLEAIAIRHDIAHVNLFDPFQGRGSRELYFQGMDDHWNDRGQDLAAQVVTGFLDAKGLLRDLSRRPSRRSGSG